MTEEMTAEHSLRPLRIAVVGAGPAGVYASDILLRQLAEKGEELGIGTQASIDLFERLPVPFGLVRYGVAPDHPAIKWIMGALEKAIDNPNIRLFCNVDFGTDLHLDDLKQRYDAVIFATGAIDDRSFDIPGADLPQVHGAAQFVEWYDGYPQAPREWNLSARSVAVIGGGNVAMDISRMIVKNADDLLATDIPANVYDGLKANEIKDLHLFVRRGPAQAKFSVQELRELEKLHGVQLIVDPADFDDAALAAAQESGDKLTRQMLDELGAIRSMAADMARGGGIDFEGKPAMRRYHFHFFSRPVEVVDEDGAVRALTIERTRVAADGSMQGTGEYENVPVEAVYHAIGYCPVRVAGVPYDEARHTLENAGGRVLTAAASEGGEPIPRVYATGWTKRGPVGLIGSTKSDAQETIANMLADFAADADHGRAADEPGADSIVELLRSRGIDFTGLDGWRRVDAAEREAGAAAGRTRIKIIDADQMHAISKA